MICPNCGKENPENAKFCMKCGKRMDGNIPCAVCGTLNPPEALYCIACGTRLDGRRACPRCGETVPEEAAFCTSCGYYFPTHAPSEEDTSEPQKKSYRDILSLIGGICFLAAAVFGLIFVFCINLKTTIFAGGASGTDASGSAISIYDYFSDIYKALGVSMKAYPKDNGYYALSGYLPAVIGTICAAGAFLAIPSCIALAGVRFANSIKGSDKNTNFYAPAVAAFALFLFTACVLLALNYNSYSTSSDASSINVSTGGKMTLGGAALAGIILGALSLAAGSVCLIIAKWKNGAGNILAIAGSTVCAVFLILVFIFGTKAGFAVTDDIIADISSSLQSNTSAYSAYYMQYIGLLFILNREMDPPSGIAASYIFSQLAQVGVLLSAALILIRIFENFTGERKHMFPAASLLLVFAVIYLASTVAFGRGLQTADLQFSEAAFLQLGTPFGETSEFSYTASIVCLVFSALLFGASVFLDVRTVHKEKPKEKFYSYFE